MSDKLHSNVESSIVTMEIFDQLVKKITSTLDSVQNLSANIIASANDADAKTAHKKKRSIKKNAAEIAKNIETVKKDLKRINAGYLEANGNFSREMNMLVGEIHKRKYIEDPADLNTTPFEIEYKNAQDSSI